MNVLIPTEVGTMQLETKYMRLRTPVTIGSHFGDWKVCWRGGWSRCRLHYFVMAVRFICDDAPANQGADVPTPRRESN
jgi:hypothetical protein